MKLKKDDTLKIEIIYLHLVHPVNMELMGKTSGKLIVYLEPSIEKNQEECESKWFVILDQFCGARCSDSKNIECRKSRDKGMAGVHGFVIRYYALRLLVGSCWPARIYVRDLLHSLLRLKIKHGIYVDVAQRAKTEEEHVRSKEEDREKERDIEIALKYHHYLLPRDRS